MAADRHNTHLKKFMNTHKGSPQQSPTKSRVGTGSSSNKQNLPSNSQRTSYGKGSEASKPPGRGDQASENLPSELAMLKERSLTFVIAPAKAEGKASPPKKSSNDKAEGKASTPKKPSNDYKSRAKPSYKVSSRHKLSKPTADGMPDEILRYIFSMLNPNDLLLCARVCRRWLELTNDNYIWQQVYKRYVVNSKRGQKAIQHPHNPPASYWKAQCIQRCSELRNKSAIALMKKIHPYTCLPANTEQALKKSGVQWCLSLVDDDSQEHVIIHRDAFNFSMATCVRWYSLVLPPIARIRKLRIFSANPVFFDGNGRPHPNSPSQRSLLVEIDFRWSATAPPFPMVAWDNSIKIYILPNNLLIGTWKDGGEMAFITANFHHHSLVRRCLLGKSDSPYMEPAHVPVQDDLDSKRGLHGYKVIVELRNQRNSFFSQQFRDLFCQPEDIGDGYATFRLIQEGRNYEHSPVGKKISFPWKTDVFKGIIQNISILDVTLLDEDGAPMWCVSAPVRVAAPGVADIVYDYDGDHFFIDYIDTRGKIKAKLVWEEEIGQYMMMSLDLQLAITFINQWFATSVSADKRPPVEDGQDAW